MSKALLFWLLMLLWLCFALWGEYIPGQPYPYRRGLSWLVEFVLLAILGWAQFGPPVN